MAHGIIAPIASLLLVSEYASTYKLTTHAPEEIAGKPEYGIQLKILNFLCGIKNTKTLVLWIMLQHILPFRMTAAQDGTTSTTTTTEGSLLDILKCPVPPKECPNVNVTFYLYTRDTQDNPQVLNVSNPDSIKNAKLIADQPVKMLIHGYTKNHNESPNIELRPAYFKLYDYNIISVDYAPLAPSPCYVQAVINVPLIANCTAQLVDAIVSSGKVPLEKFHIIGFSLGGQVLGQISNYLKSGELERATGLDPAFPLYSTPDPEMKLDKSDAKFVDVYHTNPGANGKIAPSGTVDIYFNKGQIQPGCETTSNPESCSHYRAPAFYAESINTTGNKFLASPCSPALCLLGVTSRSEYDVVVGEYIDTNIQGAYHVETNSESLYAKGS